MDVQDLKQLSTSLFWLMAIFVFCGASWAVWPMCIAFFVRAAISLASPGVLRGLLYGLIGFIGLGD